LPYSEFDYNMREKEDVYTAMAGDGGYDCGRFPGDAAQLACFDFKHCLAYIQPELNYTVFSEVCSLLLSSQKTAAGLDQTLIKPTPQEVWGYGVLCVSLISLTSVVGVTIMPVMTKLFYSRLLSVLIGLAVGSLSGSAVFHLIPSAFRLAEVSFYPHHSYLDISLTIWLGIYLFFLLERFLKIFMEYKSRLQGHSHPVQPQELLKLTVDPTDKLETNGTKCGKPENDATPGLQAECGMSAQDSQDLYKQSRPAIRASFGHMDKPHPISRPTVDSVKNLTAGNRIATVAWMVIFGDGIHNFIDGLSIGAAFSESILTGISVSMAVLCEEFPHELGDFAVLLNAGMSMKEALLYNFLSACTCYLGLILGILLGELDVNIYIFGLAGGMFLYISLVDMVPEMNESLDTASKTSVGSALAVFFLQNLGILAGIVCLYTLARFQDNISFGQ